MNLLAIWLSFCFDKVLSEISGSLPAKCLPAIFFFFFNHSLSAVWHWTANVQWVYQSFVAGNILQKSPSEGHFYCLFLCKANTDAYVILI